MADVNKRVRCTLYDLPSNFSLEFLKCDSISLKSRQKGFSYFSEGYIHDVNLFQGDNCIVTSDTHLSFHCGHFSWPRYLFIVENRHFCRPVSVCVRHFFITLKKDTYSEQYIRIIMLVVGFSPCIFASVWKKKSEL